MSSRRSWYSIAARPKQKADAILNMTSLVVILCCEDGRRVSSAVEYDHLISGNIFLIFHHCTRYPDFFLTVQFFFLRIGGGQDVNHFFFFNSKYSKMSPPPKKKTAENDLRERARVHKSEIAGGGGFCSIFTFLVPYLCLAFISLADREKLIRWGERYPASFPSGWIFQAFDPRVCGASLLDNISSSWPAVVSTASACLGLPSEVQPLVWSMTPTLAY